MSKEEDVEIKSVCNGECVVLVPSHKASIVPLFCQCCEMPMRTLDDSLAFRKSGVCSSCDGRWTNHKSVNWSLGQFPKKDTEEWQEYIEERRFYAKSLLNFK